MAELSDLEIITELVVVRVHDKTKQRFKITQAYYENERSRKSAFHPLREYFGD